MKENKTSEKRGHVAGFGRHGEHPYGDLGQIIILLVFLTLWILDSFVLRYSTFLSPYVPIYLRAIAAGLLFVVAIYLLRSGHRAISDGILSSQRLIKDGAFARVRHPLYLAVLLFYVFLIIITFSLISLFFFVGVFFFYNHIAAYEENFLERKFAQDYRDYKKAVRRWFPRLWFF